MITGVPLEHVHVLVAGERVARAARVAGTPTAPRGRTNVSLVLLFLLVLGGASCYMHA